ncbi:MAG: class I SAM-dependent methyltransferase [Planctomycetota bacterium]|jgi:SAM-dependent methyltransferase
MKSILLHLHAPIYNSRLEALSDAIVPYLQAQDRVLDVGCGSGMLATSLRAHPRAAAGLELHGLERVARGGEPIPVTQYDGKTIPFENDSFDVVIIADVLHHEENPDHLLGECARVSSRIVIVKDHKPEGFLAQQRISFMDWAANAGYGVPCLYRYNTREQWNHQFEALGLAPQHELATMSLYPPLVNLIFGRRLQYLAVVTKQSKPNHPD